MIKIISSLILPGLVLFVLMYGIVKKENVYDLFVEGAKESFDMVLSLFPSMLAMILGVNILVKSEIIPFKYIKNTIGSTTYDVGKTYLW